MLYWYQNPFTIEYGIFDSSPVLTFNNEIKSGKKTLKHCNSTSGLGRRGGWGGGQAGCPVPNEGYRREDPGTSAVVPGTWGSCTGPIWSPATRGRSSLQPSSLPKPHRFYQCRQQHCVDHISPCPHHIRKNGLLQQHGTDGPRPHPCVQTNRAPWHHDPLWC